MRWTVATGPVRLDIELLPWCQLRTSGMPMAMLNGVRSPELVGVVDRLAGVERRLDHERADFLGRRWPELRAATDVRTPLYRAHKQVSALAELDEVALGGFVTPSSDWPELWNRLVAERDQLARSMVDGYDRAVARSAAATMAALDREDVQHAIFVSNPTFFTGPLRTRVLGVPAGDVLTGDGRRVFTTAHRYVRRFASRCETTSFFGPVTFTRLDPDCPAALTVDEGGTEDVFLGPSTWLVEEVHARLVEDCPPGTLVVSRSPLFRGVPGGTVVERGPDGRQIRVPEPLYRLWRAAGDGVPLAELGTTRETVRALGSMVTVAAVPLPATEQRPLDLLAQVDTPDRLVQRLRELLDAYALAGWPERIDRYARLAEFVGGTGIDQRRHAGKHYADRELCHEDRSSRRSGRTVLGRPTVDGLRAALSAVLPLCYLGALLSREDARDCVRRARAGGTDALIRLAGVELAEEPVRLRELRHRLAELVRGHPRDANGAVALTSSDVDGAVRELWTLVPPDDLDPCLPSPDLMFVGGELGTGQWLLSELHDDCGSIYGGVEAQLFDDPARLFDDFLAAAGRVVPPAAMATIVSRRRSAHVTPELPGISIELSGRSGKPRADVRPIAAVRVAADARRLLVDGQEYLLYPGDLAAPIHRAVSLPAVKPVDIDLGAHTPRVLLDGVILQRARWRVRLPEAPVDRFARWRQVMRLRAAHGLPDRVFLRHPRQPKPLYVDFADPLAVLDLARLGPADVLFTEMLPTPDQLWWTVDGQAQCAEIRLGLLVSAGAAGADHG